MTIASTATRKEYVGNGVTTAFPFPYQFQANTDLVVYERTIATGAIVKKTYGTDYTVTGAGSPSGGTVTAAAAPANTKNWIILRDPAIAQGVALVNGEKIDVEAAINGPLDALTLQVQRQNDRNDRSLRAPDGDLTANAAMELPNSVARAGKWLGFDGAGLPVALAAVPNGESVGAFTKKYFNSPYAALDDADTAASGASAQLSIDGDTTLAADQEFSSPVAFEGGRITRGSHAVTFNSEAALGARPAFDASGTGLVIFSRIPRIDVRAFGVEGDGTTDDANALTQAILSANASKSVLFGNNSLACNVKSGITLPPTLRAELNGMRIQPDATLTSGGVVTVDGTQTGYVGTVLGRISGLQIFQALTSNHADTSRNLDGLILGSASSASSLRFDDLDIQGFRDLLVIKGPNVYLEGFFNPRLYCGWRRGISNIATSNSGENFNFHGGVIANINNTTFDGTGVYVDSSVSSSEFFFHGTSFDYCDVSADIHVGLLQLTGCHLENNTDNPHIKLTRTTSRPNSDLVMSGGFMGSGSGSVTWSGISAESSSGRPALVTTTGGSSRIIVRGTNCGRFQTAQHVTEILKSTDGVANNIVDIEPIMDGSNSLTSSWPQNISFSTNDLYLGANGSTTGWDTTNIGGGSIASDTTAGNFQSPDTGARKITVSSGGANGSVFQKINVRGKRQICAKAWVKTDSSFVSGAVQIRMQFFTAKGDNISDQTSVRTVTGASQPLTEIAMMVPIPQGAEYVQACTYWNGSPTASSFFFVSNEHVWTW